MYRVVMVNQIMRLEISTNSQRINQLIGSLLELENSQRLRPKVTIKVLIEERPRAAKGKRRGFVSGYTIGKNQELHLSLKGIADVYLQPQKGYVKARVFSFGERFKERLLDFVLMQPLRYILAYHGMYFMHASLVGRGDSCVVINGLRNSGKTTLSLALAGSNFDLLADDDCYLRLKGEEPFLIPFYTKAGLSERALFNFPKFKELPRGKSRYGRKLRFSHKILSGKYPRNQAYRCKGIIFPEYRRGKGIILKEISNDKTLEKLSKINKALYPPEALRPAFLAFYLLSRKTASFILTYNDKLLREVPGKIERIFG